MIPFKPEGMSNDDVLPIWLGGIWGGIIASLLITIISMVLPAGLAISLVTLTFTMAGFATALSIQDIAREKKKGRKSSNQ
ncbi:MAG: hypothetical protein QXP42_02975 [Candidatus Micrarchaeia archaeon]